MPADASRRFLVAAGTEHYDGGDELASVPEDLGKMAGFFGRLGYCVQLPEVRLNPSSNALRRALSEWLNCSDRQASDTAVIYYSGHGDSQASYFYLLTADSKENRYADTALRADYVLEALGEDPRVRRVLLILDACYAGQGAFDAASVAARMSPWQNLSADDEGIWVVAAASSRQEAQERLFADAFIQAAEQLQQTTGTLQPYIGLEALIWQINAILQRSGTKQRATWIPATQARGLAPFIPNARYEPDGQANVDLETRDWLRRRHAAELAEYWGPKARGVEVAAQAGWYFTGREAALVELSGWLADPAADPRLRVLTGDPGSGKSAVLGRLVTSAAASPSSKPPGAPADPIAMPPAGSITVALLARGKTADELLAELAAGLGGAASTELADMLPSRPVFTVVIDALDEAADPPAVIEQIISPLHGAASPGRGPRLLVATRRYQHLLRSLPVARVTVDLDQDTYYKDTDTANYVTKVLLAADDPDSPTPYRNQPDLARPVASQLAAIAGHSFLIAQVAARTLARTPRPLDPAEVSADRQRWRDVGAAFDRDLGRYGEKASRVRDLLTPLAWAEGAGLPRELWAALATALADDRTYTQADISWLLEQAGFYLVETLDHDRSVYRLYHEQFAEHLRGALSSSSAHARITAELLRHVPAAAEGRREWLAATQYIRAHLATHAAKSRMLDPLVNDPGFLLAADPARLLPTMASVAGIEARKSASAFESTQYLLRGQPPGQAAAQLDLAAHIHDATMLADGIARLPYKRPWAIAWGHWVRPDRHVLLGRQSGSAQAVAAAMLDSAPVAIICGRDGTVRVWDLRTGAPRGEPLCGYTAEVEAVAVGEVDGTPVAVTGSLGGPVQMWDLRARTALGKPLLPGGVFRRLLHRSRIYNQSAQAVAVGTVDGTPVAVTGGRDGTVRVWDLRTGAARGAPLRGHTGAVQGVAVGEVDGTPLAVTGGFDGTVRVWDLRTGATRGAPLRGHTGAVQAVAVGKVDGTAITGGFDGTVRVWDLRAGAHEGPLRGRPSGVCAVAVGDVNGTPMAITGGSHGTVCVWDLRTGATRGDALRGLLGWVEAVAIGEVDGTPVAVIGGLDGVQMWDPRNGGARGKTLLPGGVFRRLLHLSSSLERAVQAVAVGTLDGTPVAVTGGFDGTVRVWDLRTRTTRGKPLRGHSSEVQAVAVGEVDGTPVAVSGGRDGTVRVWDLRTGAARGESLRGHGSEVHAVAVGQVGGTPVVVSGDDNGTISMWVLDSDKRASAHLDFTAGIASIAFAGQIGWLTITKDGSLFMWHPGPTPEHATWGRNAA